MVGDIFGDARLCPQVPVSTRFDAVRQGLKQELIEGYLWGGAGFFYLFVSIKAIGEPAPTGDGDMVQYFS